MSSSFVPFSKLRPLRRKDRRRKIALKIDMNIDPKKNSYLAQKQWIDEADFHKDQKLHLDLYRRYSHMSAIWNMPSWLRYRKKFLRPQMYLTIYFTYKCGVTECMLPRGEDRVMAQSLSRGRAQPHMIHSRLSDGNKRVKKEGEKDDKKRSVLYLRHA